MNTFKLNECVQAHMIICDNQIVGYTHHQRYNHKLKYGVIYQFQIPMTLAF